MPGGGEPAHEVGTAAAGADRKAAADDLAQTGEIGVDTDLCLIGTVTQPKAGDDLVEDEDT